MKEASPGNSVITCNVEMYGKISYSTLNDLRTVVKTNLIFIKKKNLLKLSSISNTHMIANQILFGVIPPS